MYRLSKYLKPVILLTLLATLLLSTRLTDATIQSRTNDTLVASQPAQPEPVLAALPHSVATQADVEEALQSAPVMFIENVGQFDDDARFHVRGGDYDLWLANDALWITLLESPDDEELREPFDPEARLREPSHDAPRKGVNLKLSFVDANPQPEIEPFNLLETKMNYFFGNDEDKWRSNVPVWGGVRYKEVYPGIDLELTSENGHSVQRLVVHSRANFAAAQVQLHVEGAEEMELLPSPSGRGAGGEGLPRGEGMALTVKTAIGDVTLPLFTLVTPNGTPLDSTRAPTLNHNRIQAPFAPASQEALSRVPDSTLTYSTFIGGSSLDWSYELALDSAGNAVVTGYTSSSDFPTTAGSYDTSYNGASHDAFVLKLSAAGNALLYSTFIGGFYFFDYGYSLALDSADNAVVTGVTTSSNFPTTQGSYDTIPNGAGDMFVLQLSSAGDALIYSTLIGGSSNDVGLSLALDSAGNPVVTGYTNSSNFPTTAGSYDTTYNGNYETFVLQLNSAGDALIYSTFLGGSSEDFGESLALDSAGNAVVTGYTFSSNFPTTAGSYDTTHNGARDTFVLQLNSAGDALIYSTFLGGEGSDISRSLALDSADNPVVAGYTNSSNFPTTAGSYDTTHNGDYDAFVLQLNSAGDALIYSTFLGGSSDDNGYELKLDSAGNPVVTGSTASEDFPTTAGSYDTTHNGDLDAFVLKLESQGDALSYSTFIGGSSEDRGLSLALDSAGDPVITGWTLSENFPTTAGSYDTTHNGGYDLFVLRLDELGSGATPTPTPTEVPPVELACNGASVGFEGGIPSNWQTLVTDGAVYWSTTTDSAACGNGMNQTGGSGFAACADSGLVNPPSEPYDTELWTPAFDLSEVPTATLQFAAAYRDINPSGDHFEVDVWDGTSWHNALTWNEDHRNPGELVEIDLTDYAGQSDVKVRFRYYGDGWDWWSQVDDVQLSCGQLTEEPEIRLEKTVGTESDVCATSDSLTLPTGGGEANGTLPAEVTYCYKVINTSEVTFELHDLVDDKLGTLLSDESLTLEAGQSLTHLETTTVTMDTLNMATWTASSEDGSLSAEASDSAEVRIEALCGATIQSVGNGEWDESNTWDLNRVPNGSDIVLIQEGHIVDGRRVAHVQGFCNVGTLQSPSGESLKLTSTTFFKNYGQILGLAGSAGSGNSCGTIGSSLDLRGKPFLNEGTIQAGNGGNGERCGGAGGTARIMGHNSTNSGLIAAGDGGDVTSAGTRLPQRGTYVGGRGGDTHLRGNFGGSGFVDNTGTLQGGDGGDGHPDAVLPQSGGNGGCLYIYASWLSLTDNQWAGLGGEGTGGGPDGMDGCVSIDPSIINLSGPNTTVRGGEIKIFGGDDWVLDLSDMATGAISATGNLMLAVGEGGSVDLRDNESQVFQVAGEVTIASDEIELDDTTELSEIIQATKVQTQGHQILVEFGLDGPGRMVIEPKSKQMLALTVLNNGPMTDTYTLSLSDPDGWTQGSLPSPITVAGLESADVSLMILPPAGATDGDMTTLTLMATSQSDPSAPAAEFEVEIVVEGGSFFLHLPLISRD